MKRRLALFLALPVLTSCVIAESPPTYPAQKPERPTIIQSRTVPTTSKVLGSFPEGAFLVPVKLFDPTQVVEWQVFVDFDPLNANVDATPDASGKSSPVAGSDSTPGAEDLNPSDPRSGIRRIEFTISKPEFFDRTCHTIEFIVATENSIVGNTPRSLHQVDPLQSDQVTWFYSENGDLAGCPVEDAPVPPYELGPGLQGEAVGAR